MKRIEYEWDQTAESIRRAKAQQQAERAATGLRFDGDRVVSPMPAFRIHCTIHGCKFVASARGEQRAMNELAAHLIAAHTVPLDGKAVA